MGDAYATAFKLLTLGYSVIPSGGGDKGKVPLVNWRDWQTTKPDESQLETWQNQFKPDLWGIVTNECVAVIDADTPETRAQLEKEIGEPHVTTPRGGAHWYINTTGHPMKTVTALLPGVDVRGVGGFVNIAGGKYKILRLPVPGDTVIPWDNLPKRILAALNGNKPVPKTKQGTPIPETKRNATLTGIAGAMRRRGADQAAIEAALLEINASQCQPPLAESEVRRIAASVSRYEPKPDTAPHAPRGYIITDGKGKQALDIEALINDLLADFHFATLRDNDEVLIYRDGYYQPQGKRFIKSECQRRVGVSALLTEHKVNEITGHIIRSTYVDRKAFNASKFTLNLVNGLLNTRTRELRPHTPDYLSTIRIPVTYDENADCPAIRQFLSEVHHHQDIPVVEEIAGYCLTPDNSIQKAILIVGGGGQGKSTELSLFKAFIGADNCSNVPWHALELNRFAMSTLEGKLANIFADLPSQSLSMVSAFKMLTGGDTIGTEKKFGDYYSFVNYAKLIFSANKPPRVQDEDSYAFWRRWIILDFPNQISEDKKNVNILDKLTTPAELSGFLNIALDGLARLRAAGRFSYDKSVEATSEYYLRAADPVYAFLQDCVEVGPKDWVTKDALYNAFQAYCVTQCLPVSKPNSFARSLQNQAGYRISSTRPEVDGKRVTAWQGIKISVKDVKDVNVFSLSKGHAQRDDNTHNNIQKDIKIEKNVGNLDAIASITHDHQNPDANDLPDCLACGRNEWTYSPDGDLLCPCGKSLKGGEQ